MNRRPSSGLSTRHLFGCDFVDDATLDDVMDVLLAGEVGPRWSCVVTPNVDHLVRYDRNPGEYEPVRHATIVLPDGMPIVWASRWLGEPLQRRLTGSDLFARLWPRLARDGTSTVVVASSDAVAGRLAEEHPGAAFVVPPMFEPDDDAAVGEVMDRIVDTCAARQASFLFVGLSMPKANLIAEQLRRRWDGARSPHVLLVGAAPNLYLGDLRRAPAWMQRAGLEWLHRLVVEPRRMARRYLVEDPWFIRLVLRERRRLRHRD